MINPDYCGANVRQSEKKGGHLSKISGHKTMGA